MVVTVCGLTVISIVYLLILLSCKKCHKYVFYQERDVVFKEYTYQRLFLKPSNSWTAKFNPRANDQIVSENDSIHGLRDFKH